MLRRGLLAGVAGLLVARRAMAFGPAPTNQAGAWVPKPGPQPSGNGASLDLNFLIGTFPAGIAFTRNSTATYFDSTGALQSAAVNVPRLDWNPSTLALQGFLIEEARTNSLLNSNVPATQNVTVTAVPWTLSLFGSGTIVMSGAFSGTLTGSGSFPTTRTQVTFTPTAGTLTLTISGAGIGGQLELGGSASSYIPTLSAPVTRQADQAKYLTGAWYNPAAISCVAEGNILTVVTALNLALLAPFSDGTFANRVQFGYSGLGGQDFEAVVAGTGVSCAGPGTALVPGANFKSGITFGPTSTSSTVNGVATAANTRASPGMPTVTQMEIGNFTGGAYVINGHMRRLRYWPRILSPAELQFQTT